MHFMHVTHAIPIPCECKTQTFNQLSTLSSRRTPPRRTPDDHPQLQIRHSTMVSGDERSADGDLDVSRKLFALQFAGIRFGEFPRIRPFDQSCHTETLQKRQSRRTAATREYVGLSFVSGLFTADWQSGNVVGAYLSGHAEGVDWHNACVARDNGSTHEFVWIVWRWFYDFRRLSTVAHWNQCQSRFVGVDQCDGPIVSTMFGGCHQRWDDWFPSLNELRSVTFFFSQL